MLPEILSTYPKNKEKEVEFNTSIIINFDQKLDPMSINDSNISVINLNTNEIITNNYEINIGSDFKTIELMPINDLQYRNEIKVEINSIVSWNLEMMLGTYEFFFETKDGDMESETPNTDEENSEEEIELEVVSNLSISGKYLVGNRFHIEFNVIDEYGIKRSDVFINAQDFKYEDIFLVKNDAYSSAEEAAYFGDKISIVTPGNTYIYKNKLIIDISKLDENTKLIGGASYYLIINQIPLGTEDYLIESDLEGYEFTVLNNMYATVDSIESYFSMLRLDKFANDDDIAYSIYNNSRLAEYLVSQSTNSTISFNPVDPIVTNFVSEKTKYDIIFAKYTSMSSSSQRKKLDDLEIEYTYSLADLMNMLDTLKRNYQKWEDKLSGSTRAKSATFQKGIDVDIVPDFISSREVGGW